MKITINVDCTPEEARTFLGLPDVKPLQEAMMADMQDRMKQSMAAMDPDSLMKMWMPGTNTDAWEGLQKSLWSQMMGQASKKEG